MKRLSVVICLFLTSIIFCQDLYSPNNNVLFNLDKNIASTIVANKLIGKLARIKDNYLLNKYINTEKLTKLWRDSVWITDSRELYKYDNNHNQIILLSQNKYDTWENSFQEIYTFDNNNNLVEEQLESWNGSEWEIGSKFTYTYDLNNNLIEYLDQYLKDSLWENWEKFSYQYDENDNLIQFLYQYWKDSTWINRGKQTYSYNDKDDLIEHISQDWDDVDWKNSFKKESIYDSNNNLKEVREYFGVLLSWIYAGKIIYIYDANNNMIEFTTQDNTEQLFRKVISKYDDRNNLLEELHQEYETTSWKDVAIVNSTYNENNNLIEKSNKLWQESFWLNGWKRIYSYSLVTDIDKVIHENIKESYQLFNNYPNPFNPTTIIEYSIPQNCNVSLIIYDLQGREITSLVNENQHKGNYSISFNGTNVSSGIYFYKLQADNFVSIKKMAIIK